MIIPKKLLLTLLVLCLAGTLLAGCHSEPELEAAAEEQIVTVERGDLVIDITAAGNLALSQEEDLAFEIAGTVEEVLVEEGDVVEEGQVLAQLDMSEWEDNLEVLEDDVTTEERDLLQAQINLITAEQSLKSTKDTKQLALINAQISLDTAQHNLDEATAKHEAYETDESYTWPELEEAQADVNEAKAQLQYALDRVHQEENEGQTAIWEAMIERYTVILEAAEARFNALLIDYDPEEVSILRLRVESAEMSLAQAKEALDEVAGDIATKELQLTLTQGKLKDAEKALEDAQEALGDARSDSPIITAPFAGFITTVNVEGGDEILKGTVAVQLADPNKFEADILVSEMDILQLGLGKQASVQVDAMPGMSFPAKITHISPTATIQSGVVNYEVKVELQSLVPQEPTVSEAQSRVNLEGAYEMLDKAVADGKLTQEEADVRRESWEERTRGLSQGEVDQAVEGYRQFYESASREQIIQVQERLKQAAEELTEEEKQQLQERYAQSTGASQQQQAMLQQGAIQLREGLTVTVSIILQERTNVLLVPNKVIITRGEETFVQVIKDGVTEQRPVRTGLSGWQNTEIIEGLSEGEQVVIPRQTTTTSSSQPRGFFMGR